MGGGRGGRGGPGVLVLNAGMADWLTQKRQINSLRRNLERRERPIYLSRNEEGKLILSANRLEAHGQQPGCRTGKGLGELAAGEAPNLQELEEEIENGNLIQKHERQSSTHFRLRTSPVVKASRMDSRLPCWNSF